MDSSSQAHQIRPARPAQATERSGPGIDETLRGSPNDGAGTAPNTEASLLWSLALGAALTITTYALLWPVQSTAFGEVLFNPNPAIGWVPPTLVLLSAWAASMLILKRRKYRAQLKPMKLDILPTNPVDIEPQNVESFIQHIRTLSDRSRESFLLNRVARGLAHFRSRQSRTEVGALLASQAEIDLSRVVSSYTMLRTLIWAIPILGFIGTVLGIGTAVDGFSGLSDLNQLESSLAVVTSGLAGAFETTLIALVLSMLIMLPTAASQKSEQSLLSEVDEFCNDSLMRRLKEDTDTGVTPDWKGVGGIVAREMKEEMSGFGTEIGAQVGAEAGEQLAAVMRREIGVAVQAIEEILRKAADAAYDLNDGVSNLADEVNTLIATIPAFAKGLGDIPREMRAEFEAVVERIQTISTELEKAHQRNIEIARSVSSGIDAQGVRFEQSAGELSASLNAAVSQMNTSAAAFAQSASSLSEVGAGIERVAAGLEFRGASGQVRAAMDELSGAVQRMLALMESPDAEANTSKK